MAGVSNNKSIRTRSWIQFGSYLLLIVLAVIAGSFLRIRLDLTEDKRYTLSEPTRKVLSDIRNDIFVQVYLDGEMPIPFKRLQRSVRELLDEFRIASGRKVDYAFINPSGDDNREQREALYQSLILKGLNPVNIRRGCRGRFESENNISRNDGEL